jgi:hypothetical protein
MGCGKGEDARGSNVEKVCDCMKRFYPKRRGEMSMEEECADDIISSAEETLGFAILGRSMGTGKMKGDTISGEEFT